MTPEEFCKIENFNSMTIKELRKICQDFSKTAADYHYFEGHSTHKDEFSLVSFLKRIQGLMRIDKGLK